MNLSIIIVSWNTRPLLEKCLAAIFTDPPSPQFEVWVVDNASSDGSAEMVQERFPQVRLVVNDENAGFARSNNQAIRRSTGRYVLLLNPDTEVRPGALKTLVRFLQENPEVGAAGARLVNSDGSLQVSCHPAPTLGRELWRLFHLDKFRRIASYPMDSWDLDHPRSVDVLMGACLLLRRPVLDQVGLLDEEYFMYTEEVDLCYRVRRAGWKLAWVPRAVVLHYGGQSTQQVARDMFLNLYGSKVLYFRKNFRRPAVRIYKAILFAAAAVRVMLAPLALLEAPSRRRQHLTLSGYYRCLLSALPDM